MKETNPNLRCKKIIFQFEKLELIHKMSISKYLMQLIYEEIYKSKDALENGGENGK